LELKKAKLVLSLNLGLFWEYTIFFHLLIFPWGQCYSNLSFVDSGRVLKMLKFILNP
jgi:hypothetical protein